MLEFVYEEVEDWPALAWLARLQAGGPEIAVWHGSGVETRPGWFCEAAWAGDFEQVASTVPKSSPEAAAACAGA